MTLIRLIQQKDWPATWAIIEPVFRAGETYSFDATITKEDAYRVWVTQPAATFVAKSEDGSILGTYYIKPNQPGQGAHVCVWLHCCRKGPGHGCGIRHVRALPSRGSQSQVPSYAVQPGSFNQCWSSQAMEKTWFRDRWRFARRIPSSISRVRRCLRYVQTT